MHFNRIGCRLHNLRPYFTCAQPPIRPYSPRLLSRFSPSSSGEYTAPPTPDENVSRFHEKCLRADALPDLFRPGSRLIPTSPSTCLVVARSFPCRSFARYPPFARIIMEVVGLFFTPNWNVFEMCMYMGFLSARTWKSLNFYEFRASLSKLSLM